MKKIKLLTTTLLSLTALTTLTACSTAEKMVKDVGEVTSSMVSTVSETTKSTIDSLTGSATTSTTQSKSMVEDAKARSTPTSKYIQYQCSNKRKLEVSYVFVGEKPMTASTKLNGKPMGVLEFDEKSSSEDRVVLKYKKTSLILEPSFTLATSEKMVPIMLTKDQPKVTQILAKACEIKEIH